MKVKFENVVTGKMIEFLKESYLERERFVRNLLYTLRKHCIPGQMSLIKDQTDWINEVQPLRTIK